MEQFMRRANRIVDEIREAQLTPRLVNMQPFVVEIEGFEVRGLDPPPMRAGYKASIERPQQCLIVRDNLGSAHYIWQQRSGAAATNWLFSKPAVGPARVFNDWIDIPSRPPDGREENFRLNRFRTLTKGTVLSWSYALQRSWYQGNGRAWGVLAADGYRFPIDRPDSRPQSIDMWPEYVQRLRKTYKTEADWARLIAALEGKFPEDMFPRGAPIAAAARQQLEGGYPVRDGGPSSRTAYCFDGSLQGLDLARASGITVEAGVHWGETGHLAWIYRVNGKIAVIVVDKPIPDSAAWVFLDPEGAAQLVNPPLQDSIDWRDRHRGLREKAVYYCPHLEGWKHRLLLLVLSLLGEAGYGEAMSLCSTLSVQDDEYRRAARHVRRVLADYAKPCTE